MKYEGRASERSVTSRQFFSTNLLLSLQPAVCFGVVERQSAWDTPGQLYFSSFGTHYLLLFNQANLGTSESKTGKEMQARRISERSHGAKSSRHQTGNPEHPEGRPERGFIFLSIL